MMQHLNYRESFVYIHNYVRDANYNYDACSYSLIVPNDIQKYPLNNVKFFDTDYPIITSKNNFIVFEKLDIQDIPVTILKLAYGSGRHNHPYNFTHYFLLKQSYCFTCKTNYTILFDNIAESIIITFDFDGVSYQQPAYLFNIHIASMKASYIKE